MKPVSTTPNQKVSQVWRPKQDTIMQERHSFQSTSTTSAATTSAISIPKLIVSLSKEDKVSSSLQPARELIQLVDMPQIPHSLFTRINSEIPIHMLNPFLMMATSQVANMFSNWHKSLESSISSQNVLGY